MRSSLSAHISPAQTFSAHLTHAPIIAAWCPAARVQSKALLSGGDRTVQLRLFPTGPLGRLGMGMRRPKPSEVRKTIAEEVEAFLRYFANYLRRVEEDAVKRKVKELVDSYNGYFREACSKCPSRNCESCDVTTRFWEELMNVVGDCRWCFEELAGYEVLYIEAPNMALHVVLDYANGKVPQARIHPPA